MKNLLLILTLLLGLLTFSPKEEAEDGGVLMPQKEAVMKEKGAADTQYYLDVLRSDLKECKGLNARRTLQVTDGASHLRTQKVAEKMLQDLRLKEMNVQRKVMENVSEHQTINLSTLICRTAQHVFALRKILV